MKKILILLFTIILTSFQVFASDIDTQILDELNKGTVDEINVDFKLKTFESCSNLESVMGKYIKDYYAVNKNNYNQPISYRELELPEIMGDMEIMDDMVIANSVEAVSSKSANSGALPKTGGGIETDFSKTNTQVEGVDESDIIKTDGKHVYYYNAEKKYIYIIEAYGSDKMKILKKIQLPKNFNQPVLYIGDNKLIILAGGYSQINYSNKGYYINRNSKTYTIVYDVTNKTKPQLEKLYVNDGDLRKSRKIGKYLYVISNNNFSIPYHSFKSIDDIDISINNILPKKLEISKTPSISNQNLKIKGKSLPYNIRAGNVAKCSDIEYSLPDSETLKNFNFNPSYNIVSIIDTENSSAEVKTKVVAGNNSEIYMSLDNLYLTDNIYQTQNFICPIGADCIMPMYWGGTNNTIVHKMNIQENSLKYQTSTLLPGSPLTQYSMDEKNDNFRIITSTNNWGLNKEQHTDLFILDKDLKLLSNLSNLGENENFKSSRFMGDKLFLVTFKQVDPFYVIDLEDSKNPKILGELKIPGYSEYLHPYDENHIIGLGRDTFDSDGRTKNGGLKVDLYEINYDKKVGISTDCEKYGQSDCPEYCDVKIWNAEEFCNGNVECLSGMGVGRTMCVAKQDSSKTDYIEVKQKFSKTFGDAGSYSAATSNPRMFMWNADKKLLLLPATIYNKFSPTDYRNKDFFQGLLTLNINKDLGISEKYRITHIDDKKATEERIRECAKYSGSTNDEPKCNKLIGGGEVCDNGNNSNYIPKYCYADSTVGEYIADKNWNYRNKFIKRSLWIGEDIYTISDSEIGKIDMNTGDVKDFIEME